MSLGPFRTKGAALKVRLPVGTLLRVGNPGTSPVRAIITDDGWVLNGRSRFWQVELGGMRHALVTPVPLVEERRAAKGALEHLGARMSVRRASRPPLSC